MQTKPTIPATLYDEAYYLGDNEGFEEFKKGLDENIHPKFQRALKLVNVREGDFVLDVGCGRGELVYYLAKKGARVVGVDYSESAIKLAKQTIAMLSEEIRQNAAVSVGDAGSIKNDQQYDYIFLVEVAEHMYDWQLREMFEQFKACLKPEGKLIITTPNFYYEKYLQPLKLFLDIPFRMIKWPLRILRGKYQPKSFGELLHKIFHVTKDRGEINRQRHGNVMTPRHLKSLLAGYKVKLWCEDPSVAPISLLLKKWWGLHIVAIAQRD